MPSIVASLAVVPAGQADAGASAIVRLDTPETSVPVAGPSRYVPGETRHAPPPAPRACTQATIVRSGAVASQPVPPSSPVVATYRRTHEEASLISASEAVDRASARAGMPGR